MARRKLEARAEDGTVIVQLATRISKELYRELKLMAVEQSISITELVAEGVKDLIAKRRGRRGKERAA